MDPSTIVRKLIVSRDSDEPAGSGNVVSEATAGPMDTKVRSIWTVMPAPDCLAVILHHPCGPNCS